MWSWLSKQPRIELLPSDQFPSLNSQFPSIGEGAMLDPTGHELESTQFSDLLLNECEDRSSYVRITNKGHGRYGPQTVPVKNPLSKLTITLSGHDNARLQALERAGLSTKKFITRTATKVAKLYAKYEGMNVIALAVHADSGCIHIHVIFSHVSRDKKLLYKNPHRGCNRKRQAGIGLISTKRMCDMGFWPVEDAAKANYLLADREKETCQLPTDYLLSRYVDRECEAYYRDLDLLKGKDADKRPSPKVKMLRGVISATDRQYKTAALARRERRILTQKLFSDLDDLENVNESIADLTILSAELKFHDDNLDRGSRERKVDELWKTMGLITKALDRWQEKAKKRKPIEPSPNYLDAIASHNWVLHLQAKMTKDSKKKKEREKKEREENKKKQSDPPLSGLD